jgi:hypothetical protein
MGTPVFGLPLGKAVAPGAQVPDVLDHCLQVLSYCSPAETTIFDLPITHPDVANLRALFDAYDAASGADSPVATVENPQVWPRSLFSPLVLRGCCCFGFFQNFFKIFFRDFFFTKNRSHEFPTACAHIRLLRA